MPQIKNKVSFDIYESKKTGKKGQVDTKEDLAHQIMDAVYVS